MANREEELKKRGNFEGIATLISFLLQNAIFILSISFWVLFVSSYYSVLYLIFF